MRNCKVPVAMLVGMALGSLAMQMLIGAGLTNFRASNNTLVQLFVDNDLRGRVMSTYQLASVGMMPFGALAVGFLGHKLGPQGTVGICGTVIIVAGVVLMTWLKGVGADEPSMLAS